ncbi:hypothetical protein [Lysinibacillus fusiformis]|uniref:hypothetical protein n=1 Tax=Lysinibacillus fusiformis TaxID=28031 RepID=UPI003D081191
MPQNDLFKSALEIAFSDTKSEFLSVLKGKMGNKYIFKEYSFSQNEDETTGTIKFEVDCPPGVHCLIDPNFDVIIDFTTKKVVEIIGGET